MNVSDPGRSHIETTKRPVSKLRILFAFTACMSVYILVSLVKNERVLLAILGLMTALEFVQLLRKYNASMRLEAISEGAWFLVLLSIFLGVYRNSLMDHRVFTFATIFYRPYATNYCNPRLALGLGLTIMVAVLPVTSGIVTDETLADLLAAIYLLLVASLWALCSKPGADIFGFEKDPAND